MDLLVLSIYVMVRLLLNEIAALKVVSILIGYLSYSPARFLGWENAAPNYLEVNIDLMNDMKDKIDANNQFNKEGDHQPWSRLQISWSK